MQSSIKALQIKMRNILWTFWLIIEWAQWINGAQIISTNKQYYDELKSVLNKNATNCTEYIPENWRQWMKDNSIALGNRTLPVGYQYLRTCLHDKLVNVNETSPFQFTENPQFEFNMILNEVVSLGFDEVLVTKAWHLAICLVWAQLYKKLVLVHVWLLNLQFITTDIYIYIYIILLVT